MILMASVEPYSHVLTSFRLNPLRARAEQLPKPRAEKRLYELIRARVAAHKGAFKLLIPSYHYLTAQNALKYFGLFSHRKVANRWKTSFTIPNSSFATFSEPTR
jgi:hypothetical protein